MNTILQDVGSRDCLACVAAMVTQTTVEDFKAYYLKHNLPFDSDITFIRYLWDNGYMVGLFIAQECDVKIDPLLTFDLLKTPCFIAVKSRSEHQRELGVDHAVYWDGKKLYDPAGDDIPLDEYIPVSFLPICQNSEHSRWKENEQ